MKPSRVCYCPHCRGSLLFGITTKVEYDNVTTSVEELPQSARVACARCEATFYVRAWSDWQDEERTLVTIEQVYATRYDCIAAPA